MRKFLNPFGDTAIKNKYKNQYKGKTNDCSKRLN